MGREVIGFGYVECKDDDVEKIMEKIIKLQKKYPDHLKRVEADVGYISFDMDGHNSIDYIALEELKEWCEKNKLDVIISVNEYVESEDGGFWYESEHIDKSGEKVR